MANITANTARGTVTRINKRLREHLQALKNADQLTAGQRDVLYAKVLADLVRLELYNRGELGNNE